MGIGVQRGLAVAAVLWSWAAICAAQPPSAPPVGDPSPAGTRALTLEQAFERAWERQPERRALELRRAAAQATQRAADAWGPAPPSVGVGVSTDRVTGNRGAREFEAGMAFPLWQRGEQDRTRDLARLRLAALEPTLQAARLRLAGELREAWWNAQRARTEIALERDREASALRLASDVERRLKAGDLARADQNAARVLVQAARAAVAQAEAASIAADQTLAALIGEPAGDTPPRPERTALPPAGRVDPDPAAHPALAAALSNVELAARSRDLVVVQRREPAELAVTARRERGDFDERFGQSVIVGVRIPLMSDPRQLSRVATAEAELTEAATQLDLLRDRLAREAGGAVARLDRLGTAQAAADERERLATELRGFVSRAFMLGEIDLPTRLRVELEAVEAQRQAARAQLDVLEARSRVLQSRGIVPE